MNHEKIKIPPDLPEVYSEGIKKTGQIRRIVVDRQKCIGARACVIVAEKVFQVDDQNLAYVTDNIDTTDEETIRLAAESCPVLAILLYDKSGKQLFPENENL